MLSDITMRTQKEIEELKEGRKEGQGHLLDLLENACSKINSII